MPNQPKTKAHTVRVDDELWESAQAEADRTGVTVSDIVRKALRQMLATAPLVAALALLLVWGGREVAFVGTPNPAADRDVMMGQWVQDSIDAQLAELGCDKRQRLTDEVAVRNSARDNAGRIQFDGAVVRKVTFEQAIADAQAGKVWVVGWCA